MYIYWSTYIYIYIFLFVYIYIYIYIYISIHTYILEQGRWHDLKQGATSLWKSAPKKCADFGTELELERSATATVSNDFVWRLPGAHHPTFWVPTANLCFLVWRSKCLAFGPGRVFPRSQEKQDHDLWSHMVPEVMENGPGYTSTKESWSHQWWEMVPTSECRYRSTDLSTRSIDHGPYRRSIRIHLQRITVDGGLKSEIILWSISSTNLWNIPNSDSKKKVSPLFPGFPIDDDSRHHPGLSPCPLIPCDLRGCVIRNSSQIISRSLQCNRFLHFLHLCVPFAYI